MRYVFELNRVKWYRWLAGEQNKKEKVPVHINTYEIKLTEVEKLYIL